MSSIPLAIQQPQFASPLQSIGQLIQMRDLASQVQLRQAQAQAAQANVADIQAQAEQRNRDLADQNTWNELISDPAVSRRVHTGDFSDLEGKLQPQNLQKLEEAQATYQKSLLANTAEQNKIRSESLGKVVDSIEGLRTLTDENGEPDLNRINSALPGVVSQLAQNGYLKGAGITGDAPTSITDPQQLEDWLSKVGGAQEAHNQALAMQTSAAALKKTLGEARETRAKAEHQEIINQALKGGDNQDPASLFTTIFGANDPRIPAYVAQWNAAKSTDDPFKARNAVVEQAQREVGEVSTAKRMIPIEETKATFSSGLALRNQKQLKASADFVESAKDLAQLHTTANTVNALVDQAKAGNARAGQQLAAILPYLAKTADDIKGRGGVPSSLNVGGIGEKIAGWVNKFRTGVNASANELDQIKGVTQTLTGAADQQHQALRQTLHETYGFNSPDLMRKSAPKAGDVQDGYKFKGGDPAQQSNWEKQ